MWPLCPCRVNRYNSLGIDERGFDGRADFEIGGEEICVAAGGGVSKIKRT